MAALLPLAVAMASQVVAVAAEAAPQAPVGAPSSQDAGTSTPTGQSPALEAARRRASHRQRRPNAEDRLHRLAQLLKLDAAQQAEVRRILQAQRQALRRLMRAPADPEVPRVAVIHAITDRTAERIRAVLNDEQRKLYSQALPHDFDLGEGKPTVEEWLTALRPKGE